MISPSPDSATLESSIAVLADYPGPHTIMWATDYPVLAGGALGFYGLS